MENTLQDLEAARLAWSLKIFTQATETSSLLKLRKEIEEVEEELASPKRNYKALALEYADCVMCLLDSAGRAGVSVTEILEAFEEKNKINFADEWKKNDDNTYSRIKKVK